MVCILLLLYDVNTNSIVLKHTSSLSSSSSVSAREENETFAFWTNHRKKYKSTMAVSNFVVTLIGIGAVAMLMKTDVRTSASMLRRNLKHIRTWLEEASSASGPTGEKKMVEEPIKKRGSKDV